MSYVGDIDLAAPQLRSIRPDPVEAQDLFEQVLRAIERMLYVNVIHGDLSAYNLLVWDGLVVVIDLPQAVRPAQEPPRPRAPRTRRAAHLRALRAVRGAIGAGPPRGRPVDGVGVRRAGPRGAPFAARVVTIV
jgi:RIO kinase 1